MGSNHSKLCSGDPERQLRIAQQDALQQLYTTPETEKETVHIYCRPEEVDLFVEEINTGPVVFHFKVEKPSEIKPENSPEGGKELRAAADVSAGAKATEPSEDVTEMLWPGGDARVRSEPNTDLMVGLEAQLSEMDLTLTGLGHQVAQMLHGAEMPSSGSSKRPKGRSAAEDPSPSSLETQPTTLSSGSPSRSPTVGVAASLNPGGAHHPNTDASLVNDQKAPCGADFELPTGDTSGVSEEPTTGWMQLEGVSSEETLRDTDETPPYLSTDECSDVNTAPGTKERVGIPVDLGNGRPQAASEPLPLLKAGEGKVPEDYGDGGKVGAWPEGLPKRARRETLAPIDPEDETGQPKGLEIFSTTSESCKIPAFCKKTGADNVLLPSDAEDLRSLRKDGATPTQETTNGHLTPVVQNGGAKPPRDVAEKTGVASSPKAQLRTAETRQGRPLFSSAVPTARVNETQDDHPGPQRSPVSVSVSGPALEDGSLGQRR